MEKDNLKSLKDNNLNSCDKEIGFKITQFLGYEAMLLDENRLDEWVKLLDPSVQYKIPMRLSVKRGETGEFPEGAYRACDDLPMILKRIERTTTGSAWAEDPPSRTVRNISSVFIEKTDTEFVYQVHSALIVYRQRAVDTVWDLIPARRRDLIRVNADGCILCQRTVILTERVLQTPNLGIFL